VKAFGSHLQWYFRRQNTFGGEFLPNPDRHYIQLL